MAEVGLETARDLTSSEHEAADAYLSTAGSRFEDQGIPVESAVTEGDAARAIVEYATGHGVGLIAMANHRRSGLGRLVAGSVADEVLRSAPCPLLLVRAE